MLSHLSVLCYKLIVHSMLYVLSGLRTLCLAVADITEEFYDDWKHTYYKASTSIKDREKKIMEAAELIETVS